MIQGLGLLFFGGLLVGGSVYKTRPTWVRGQKKAFEGEKSAYNMLTRGYSRFGIYMAIAGILALITGWIALFL